MSFPSEGFDLGLLESCLISSVLSVYQCCDKHSVYAGREQVMPLLLILSCPFSPHCPPVDFNNTRTVLAMSEVVLPGILGKD